MIPVMFCPECRAEYRPGFTRCSETHDPRPVGPALVAASKKVPKEKRGSFQDVMRGGVGEGRMSEKKPGPTQFKAEVEKLHGGGDFRRWKNF
jgi:hypothetical protein